MQPSVKKIIEDSTNALEAEVNPIRNEINNLNQEMADARKEASDKKETAPDFTEKEKTVSQLRDKETELISDYAKNQPVVRQIIDLALLQSHLLSGEYLNQFINRSIDLLK